MSSTSITSASAAAASQTAAVNSATAAAASASSISTPGNSVVNVGGKLEISMPSRAISTNDNVVLSDRGKILSVTNATTVTLPSGASVSDGFLVAVRNSNSTGTNVTVQAAAGDNIDNGSSILLQRNQS